MQSNKDVATTSKCCKVCRGIIRNNARVKCYTCYRCIHSECFGRVVKYFDIDKLNWCCNFCSSTKKQKLDKSCNTEFVLADINKNESLNREIESLKKLVTELEYTNTLQKEQMGYLLTKSCYAMEPLEVVLVGFYPDQNAKEHHTEEYDLVTATPPTAIFRRGGTFYMTIRFNRNFDKEHDVVRVRFGFGPKPNPAQGTRAILTVRQDIKNDKFPDNPLRWGVILEERQLGKDIMLSIRIPANAPVGIWKCSVQTNIYGNGKNRRDYQAVEDLYIIFNPWSPDDGVFMENEEERKEYVLNETGKIWCGTFKNPKGKHWIFGQFDDIALPAAVFLLEKSGLPYPQRGSPVLVSRAISAVVNSADEGGLLEGRWDGNYADGTSPHAWTGSAAIMDQYLRTDGIPVKYGQCWVYSAATVTVCRALGIPCRSTTNYVSAHDTNRTLTVDKYFDTFGDLIENGPDGSCNDSCWNFHVWNDVWMTRPDLPKGYGGWQVIDATPQEQSDTVMRCGPASVAAIKRGDVGFLYDTPFVFSEVNADVVHYKEDEESDWGFNRISINKYHVGRKIITTQLGHIDEKGDSDLVDITSLFKNKEGSKEERLAVQHAVSAVPQALEIYEAPEEVIEDVFFDLVDLDSVPFGDDFDIVVKFHNKANAERTISVILTASSVYYTGGIANSIKKARDTFKIRPQQKNTFHIHISSSEYTNKLVDHGLIKIYAQANVAETKQSWSEEDDFTLTFPEMRVTTRDVSKVGENCDVNFSFKNPLKVPLTNCSYIIEGPWNQKARSVNFKDVKPNEQINHHATFVALRKGVRRVLVNFISSQIPYITGTTTINIE